MLDCQLLQCFTVLSKFSSIMLDCELLLCSSVLGKFYSIMSDCHLLWCSCLGQVLLHRIGLSTPVVYSMMGQGLLIRQDKLLHRWRIPSLVTMPASCFACTHKGQWAMKVELIEDWAAVSWFCLVQQTSTQEDFASIHFGSPLKGLWFMDIVWWWLCPFTINETLKTDTTAHLNQVNADLFGWWQCGDR